MYRSSASTIARAFGPGSGPLIFGPHSLRTLVLGHPSIAIDLLHHSTCALIQHGNSPLRLWCPNTRTRNVSAIPHPGKATHNRVKRRLVAGEEVRPGHARRHAPAIKQTAEAGRSSRLGEKRQHRKNTWSVSRNRRPNRSTTNLHPDRSAAQWRDLLPPADLRYARCTRVSSCLSCYWQVKSAPTCQTREAHPSQNGPTL